jgi:hypothetical protein
MRGCLFVLVLAAALIAAIAWFAPAPIVSAVIGGALQSSGYQSSSTTITATADPPPRLLLGHADRISIDSSDVVWKTLRARHLALTLDAVDLFARRADSVHGSIEDAEIADGRGGTAAASSIELAGPADAAAATITVDRATVEALVQTAVQRQFGVTATSVDLLEPDRLRIVTPGLTAEASLVIADDGSLAISTPLGTAPIVRIDPSLPLQLRTVEVVPAGLRLVGRLDVSGLLGG